MENMEQNSDLGAFPDAKFNLPNCTSSTNGVMLKNLALPLMNRL